MDIALFATVCGLLAALSWGTADFFAARASKEESGEITAVAVSIVGAVAFPIFYLFDHGSEAWSHTGIGYAVAAGAFMGLGLLFFYRGLEVGPVSVVSPVGSAYPLVTTLLVLTVLGGTLSGLQIAGILLVVAGIVAASGVTEAKPGERRLTRGVVLALITFVLWGIAFAFLGQAVNVIGWQKTTLVDIWLELAAIGVAVPLLGTKVTVRNLSVVSDKYIAGAAIIQLFGLIMFDYGLTRASSSAVITAISASYPALTIFLALRHFKEKQTIIALAGGFVTVVGVVVLSIQ
jgi:drug/metabolite transporter (DMT)-like permease